MENKGYAFCGLTVIPVRGEASDPSEIVTQLLYGECVKIIEKHNQWLKIEVQHDGYIGWVDNKQLIKISKETADILIEKSKTRYQEEVYYSKTPFGRQLITAGSPILSTDTSFQIDGHEFEIETHSKEKRSTSIVELANNYLNSPYLWGGRTKYGIDCSGFSQTVYHQVGIPLKRNASQQVLQGREVSFENKKEGDLAFFKSEISGNITHVGIVLNGNKIIHAHGRVRIDSLDETGIYNEEEKYYSHKLFNIKNY